MQPTPAFLAAPSEDAFIFPFVSHAMEADENDRPHIPTSMSMSSVLTNPSDVVDLTASTSTLSTQTGGSTPRLRPSVPSGLSLMLSRTPEDHVGSSGTVPDDSQTSTPTVTGRDFISQFPRPPPLPSTHMPVSTLPTPDEETVQASSEAQPLLSDVEAGRPAYGGNGHISNGSNGPSKPTHVTALNKLKTRLLSKDYKATGGYVLSSLVKSIPAVVLGTLLNILDGISCTSSFPLIFRHPNRHEARWYDHLSHWWSLHESRRCGGFDVLRFVSHQLRHICVLCRVLKQVSFQSCNCSVSLFLWW